MTSLVEIRKWARPLLVADPNLVLVGRWLFLKPVRHLLRGLLIDRTSSAEWSRVHYALIPLFGCPLGRTGFQWSGHLNLGRNTEPTFPDQFVTESRSVIDEMLSGVDSIGQFVAQVSRTDFTSSRRLGSYGLSAYPREHCVILAASGELEEASELLAGVASEEAKYREVLLRGQAEQTRRPRSARAKFDIEWASAQLEVTGHLLTLKEVVDRKDRPGIGQLLREWECRNARVWRVEHLWEQTPFPVAEDEHR